MKNLLKAIGAGLALGVAFFLVPLLGRVLLALLLLRMAFGLLRGRRRQPGRWLSGPVFGPLPIDGNWYRPAAAGTGPVSQVPVA